MQDEKPKPLVTPTVIEKPTVRRVRDHLTSIQINDEQKRVIDQAYQIFSNSSNDGMTKGEFLTLVAVDYIKKNSVQPQ